MYLVAVIVVVGLVALTAGVVTQWRHHRRSAAPDKPMPAEPSSCLRIIESEEELHTALVRAARFERLAAEAHRGRVAHYESMLLERSGASSNGSMNGSSNGSLNGSGNGSVNGSKGASRRRGRRALPTSVSPDERA